jgi:type I restriction enzyme, S subunit
MEVNKEKLPKGWTIAILDDVIIRMTNGANAVQYKEKVGLPISRIETISNETIDLDRVKYIKETDVNFIDKYKLRNGDILFSHINSDSHLGKTALFNIENRVTLIHGINLLLLRPSPEILPEIINYQIKYLRAHGKFSSIAQKAVNQSSINQAKLKAFKIFVPPFNEQKRILAKLEQLLPDLDKGIEYLETTKQQLKVYRQAVLKWAFEGKLTNTKLSLVKTGDVINIINNGYTPTKQFLSQGSGEIPFIKVYNLNFDGTLNFKKDPTFIPRAIHEKDLKRSVCIPGDVLINIVGPPLGKVSIVTNEFPEWNINQAIVMFRPNENISSKYLAKFLQNHVTINWLEGTSKATAGQWNVKVSTCREIPFPICSLKEQERIIKEIESRLSVCDKIEETIESNLQQAEALRLSIIKKAFEGKLVPQDPNDEPAEKLLERIRALRQAQVKHGNGTLEAKKKIIVRKKTTKS